MFCNNCGKNLTDGVKFCDGCGAQVGVVTSTQNEPENVSVQKSDNPIFKDTLRTLKGFFSKNTVKTIGEAAKNEGMEWLILGLISMMVYAFALALNVKQIIDSLLGSVGDLLGDSLYKFGSWFLYGLLISVGIYFLMSLSIYGAVKLIFKKDVSIKSVLNLVATASLPMTAAYLINIVFGFIWTPFIIIFSTVSLIATAVLLYVGMQKLEKLDKSPFVTYLGIWTVLTAIVVIVISLVVKSVIDGAINDLTSSLGSSLFGGGMSDLFDLFG